VALGVAGGLAYGVAGGLAYGVALGVAGGLAFGVAYGVAGGLAGGVGAWVNWWRPVVMSALLVPWHFWLYRIDEARAGKQPSLLHRHLAFWDEWQHLPIWGLDKHLLLILERSPLEGQAALNYLSTSRQRWAAQAAQIELDARQLERCADAQAVGQIYHHLTISELASPADTLFRSFNSVSKDVEAALDQASTYNQRLVLKAVGDRLDALIRELTRSSDKYAVRFRPIAQRWSRIIVLELDALTQAAELRQEIDSPYIIGIPLTQRQEIFVGRAEISRRIEQLLRDRRRPPLLLYGQRRTGKTSLLNNLGRLLPNSIVPLFVDLQGPASRASDHAGFLYNLAKGMADSAQRDRRLTLPALSRAALADDPFTRFDEWLDEVEITLEDDTALLALDEFEVLDQVLVEGRFSETMVLGMLRNLIQHRPRFKVLLSGSHTLEEFQRWSSYLINAQVLHLSYLKESEARQLIEHPVKDFALRYEPEASQRVLDLTRGHPFLVQLLCAEIVVLKNEQDPSDRRLATLADVEAAIPEALDSGSMFFSDIECNQVSPEALAVLRHIAAQGEGSTTSQEDLVQQFSDISETALPLLLRRELIEITPTGHRFQVELIRRWFAR
ncbi:ATP-binding protein, partial [Sphaerothrix gracilis]|uniref:nSTAND1 domain-containing NTPase n=1 Tax=Sphaerothrix gracilis TaxID=3151835 RepID=UPI0031FD26B9